MKRQYERKTSFAPYVYLNQFSDLVCRMPASLADFVGIGSVLDVNWYEPGVVTETTSRKDLSAQPFTLVKAELLTPHDSTTQWCEFKCELKGV